MACIGTLPRPLTGPAYERVATLIQGNCALYSNHLPLDGHPEIGNNALLARHLDLTPTRPFLIRDARPSVGSRHTRKLAPNSKSGYKTLPTRHRY